MIVFRRKLYSMEDSYSPVEEEKKNKYINSSIATISGLGTALGGKILGEKYIESKSNKLKEKLDNKLIKRYILPSDLNNASELAKNLDKHNKVKSKLLKRLNNKTKRNKKINLVSSGLVGLGVGVEAFNRLNNKKKENL